MNEDSTNVLQETGGKKKHWIWEDDFVSFYQLFNRLVPDCERPRSLNSSLSYHPSQFVNLPLF